MCWLADLEVDFESEPDQVWIESIDCLDIFRAPGETITVPGDVSETLNKFVLFVGLGACQSRCYEANSILNTSLGLLLFPFQRTYCSQIYSTTIIFQEARNINT